MCLSVIVSLGGQDLILLQLMIVCFRASVALVTITIGFSMTAMLGGGEDFLLFEVDKTIANELLQLQDVLFSISRLLLLLWFR